MSCKTELSKINLVLSCLVLRFESCGTRKIKGGMNLYIELQEHTKLDQIAARNIRISLDKPKAFSK